MPRHLSIVYRPLSELIPYARNARTHSDEQVAQIAASIREWGWTNPVLIDGERGIIAGHGRVLAARKLGMEEVPTIELGTMSDAQRRAYILADNKLAQNAGWDDALLGLEVAEINELGFDLSKVGFDDGEIAALLAKVDPLAEMPPLADGDREPMQNMTFLLHDDQVEAVKAALEKAKALGPFVDTGNENSNGNALARVCELFMGQDVDG